MFFRENHHRGFTLIELLVVISVIGLLSSVVLTSLNSTRAKAKDAKIMQEVRQLASLIELDYANTNSYSINFNRGWWRSASPDGGSYRPCVDATQPFVTAGSPFEAQALALCQSIITSVGTASLGALYNGVDTQPYNAAKVWSLMAWLPGKGQYFCIGSSGRTSISGYTSASPYTIPVGTEGVNAGIEGVPSSSWSPPKSPFGWISPGCHGNP